MQLEQLMNVEIMSVSKRTEKILAAPADVHVITREDIRRSGARSIAEALRLAPNLQVAQVDSHQWAISARGFNSTTANKLLVLIDGRTVYTPLYSGVFWDVQDTFLEDIERIEIISGPGATLWGANAVNGVINIITRSANEKSAQGLLVQGGGGTEERGFGGLRFGSKVARDSYVRVYAKYFERDSSTRADGSSPEDAWRAGQGGFRLDRQGSNNSLTTLQGDIYRGTIDQAGHADTAVNGGNLLGRWSRSFSNGSDIKAQFYYDRTRRRVPGTYGEILNTFDFDVQYHFTAGGRHDVLWGFGHRFSHDQIENSELLAFLPPKLNTNLVTGFLQDEIALGERLHLTFGSKFEHNDFSGFEIQPGIRVSWTPVERQAVWAAISRAVRTPSRIDRDFFVPAAPPYLLAGGPDFVSEELIAYELGYRMQPHSKFSLSLAGFYNDYDKLRSLEPGPPITLANGLKGNTYGGDLVASYRPVRWWRYEAGYNFLKKNIRLAPGSRDLNRGQSERNDPEHQFFGRSYIDLPGRIELDAFLRYVDRLPSSNAPVPGYASLDVHLGWLPNRILELSIVGQNLLDKRHPEFGSPVNRKEIQRGVYGRLTCRF